MSNQLRVVAIFTSKEGQEEQVSAAMRACVAPSRAEETNLHYEATQDVNNPRVFVMLEGWESQDALDAHMQKPHFKKLVATLQDKLDRPMDVHVLKLC